MKKIVLTITPGQLLAISSIMMSVSMDYYDDLPTLKEQAKDILNCLNEGQIVDVDSVNKPPIQKEEENLRDGKIHNLKHILPEQWFDTYNVQIENTVDLDLLIDNENLRFIFGKQKQVGIEYWDDYDNKAVTAVMFIKNSDIRDIYDELGEIINKYTSSKRKKDIIRVIVASKYEIVAVKEEYEIVVSLYKSKENDDSTDMVKFHNIKQLILFYEFLSYHLFK